MTKKAIEKLSEQARAFCESRQKIIRICRDAESDPANREEQTKAELRGYLACLLHTEAITPSEFRCLLLFYGTM
jgi:hypothetical protein